MAVDDYARINLSTSTFANNTVVNNGAVMTIGGKAHVSEWVSYAWCVHT
jgi:hypothetical protein